MLRLTCFLFVIFPIVAFVAATRGQPATSQSTSSAFHVAQVLKVPGEGSWDYLTVDSGSNLLYVPRRTHTQVIKADSGEVVGDLKDTKGVHGVALAPELGRGFTSNGGASSVTVFDIKTLKVIATVPTGEGPDAIVYDPSSKSVFAFDGKGRDVTVFAAAAPASLSPLHIALGGKPESAVSDDRGHVYVDIEDTGEVAAIDTRTMKVTERWKVEGGEEPTGLAVDPAHNRLFVGCHNQVMVIMDAQRGKRIGTVTIGHGVDACGYDPGRDEAFASCGDGTLAVVKETTPGNFDTVQTLQTRRGARTMAIDPARHTVYLPTADFLPPGPEQKRPQMKPDTFVVLVVKPE